MNYLLGTAAAIRDALPQTIGVPDNSQLLFLLYAVLCRAKGEDVTPSDVHDAWAAWMSTITPDHDAIVPFSQLPPQVAAEDAPFVDAIHDVARRAQM